VGGAAVTVNLKTNRIYVLGNPVSVISGRTNTVTATIPVGRIPQGVAADTKTNTIYVTNALGNTVSVISGRTNTVTATTPVGRIPEGVASDTKAKAIYVANSDSGTVSVLAACPK
jgi:YVTN family beta-propeller protein